MSRLISPLFTGSLSIVNADGVNAAKSLRMNSIAANTVQFTSVGPTSVAEMVGCHIPPDIRALGVHIRSIKTVHTTTVAWATRNLVAWGGFDRERLMLSSTIFPGTGHFPIFVHNAQTPTNHEAGWSANHGPFQNADVLNTVQNSIAWFSPFAENPSLGAMSFVAIALRYIGPATAVPNTSTWTLEIQFFGR